MFTRKLISIRRVPLPLGPTTYCTLANHSGGLKTRGRKTHEEVRIVPVAEVSDLGVT